MGGEKETQGLQAGGEYGTVGQQTNRLQLRGKEAGTTKNIQERDPGHKVREIMNLCTM